MTRRPEQRLRGRARPRAVPPLGHAVVDRLADHLAAAGDARHPRLAAARPRRAWSERWPADFAGGADPLALVERDARGEHGHAPPGYVGHQLAAPLPLATLGTLVTAIINGSGAIYELSQSEHRLRG